MKKQILKVLVGSQAYGLADEDSDIDYRSVYITPTEELLKINRLAYKGSHWSDGNKDNTAYEVAHFLSLALKCNPSVLEIFVAPVVFESEEGHELRELLPFVLNPKKILSSHLGYAIHQRKKYPDRPKSAVAAVRVMLQARDLIRYGSFNIEIAEPYRSLLAAVKNESLPIDQAWTIQSSIEEDLKSHPLDPYPVKHEEELNTWLLNKRLKRLNG